MAHTESLPTDTIETISKQVGERLASVADPALVALTVAGRDVELCESFSVWVLGLDAVTRSEQDIAAMVVQTGRWHHQIRYGGKARAFARSMSTGPASTDWLVTQVFESKIAERIDEAIDWLDKNADGDPLVRLLVMPAYHLHAFWLVHSESSEVLIVDKPVTYTRVTLERFYETRDFLKDLSTEQHIQGLPD